MIPSWFGVLVGAALAASVWTAIGWRPARYLLPELPGWSVAGLLGYAWAGAPGPWLLRVFGTGLPGILAAMALPALLAWAIFPRPVSDRAGSRQGLYALLAAVPIAALTLAAIMPKGPASALHLSGPLFDHLKIAIIDSILRQGMPPLNPYLAGPGLPATLSYYYGWHMQAAMLARLGLLHGWGGDAGLTFLTALAALLLVGGLARRLGAPPALAILLALPAGALPVLAGLHAIGWFAPPGGLGAFLNQASWAPQHLASAALLLLVGLLLAVPCAQPLDRRRFLPWMLGLAAVLAVSADGSAWVGGIVTAGSAPVCLLVLARPLGWPQKWRLVAAAAAAALLALLLAAPVLAAEAAQIGPHPILGFAPYPVLEAGVPGRAWLDFLAFPVLLLLVLPLPAVFGAPGLARSLGAAEPWRAALAAISLPGLAIAWCLRSTILNNDLGWRAVLPALLASLPFAAWWLARAGRGQRLLALAMAGLCLTGTWPTVVDNLRGYKGAGDFAAEAGMWRAVQALVPPDARLLSDFNRDAAMTVWPANIGWALLSDRAACFAGWGGAATFVRLPVPVLYQWDQAIVGLFAGRPGATAALASPALARCDFLLWQGPGSASGPNLPPAWRQVGAGPGWKLFRRPAPAPES